MNQDQIVVLFKNDTAKLFHVGVFNALAKKGGKNPNSTLAAHISKAKCAANNAMLVSSNRSFQHGFLIKLMNTHYSGWTEMVFDEPMSMKQARFLQAGLIDQYKKAGYDTLCQNRGKPVRITGQTGNRGWGGFPGNDAKKSLNKKMEDVKAIVDRLSIGMPLTADEQRKARDYVANNVCGYRLAPYQQPHTFKCYGDIWTFLQTQSMLNKMYPQAA